MILRDYVKVRIRRNGSSGDGTPALSKKEAKAIGVPFPLPGGWLKAYGGNEVPDILVEMANVGQSACWKGTAKSQAEKKALKALRSAERKRKKRRKFIAALPTSIPAIPPNIDPASAEFLQTYEWRKVRLIILKRDGAKCACCGATPDSGAVMNVDHIKPRKRFPHLALDPENLQVLCHDCNHGKGNWDMTDFREKDGDIVLMALDRLAK